MGDNNNPNDQKKKMFEEAVQKIAAHAGVLYEMLEDGMAVDIIFSLQSDIVIPNRPPKTGRLILMKPQKQMTIQAYKKPQEVLK